ncbi:putative DUF6590 domain-containing protein [Seiridium unicorne]|uniref:DUF6590 domain-containing protein n=1 Tax=Seiridium unicorne TaxID=138068 RepID=A0ABR2UFY8_9PEZI
MRSSRPKKPSQRPEKTKKSSERKFKAASDVPVDDIQWQGWNRQADGTAYRVGQDSNGNWYQDFRENDDSIPREPQVPQMDEVTESLGALSVAPGGSGDYSHTHSQQANFDQEYTPIHTSMPAQEEATSIGEYSYHHSHDDSHYGQGHDTGQYDQDQDIGQYNIPAGTHGKSSKNKGKGKGKEKALADEELETIPPGEREHGPQGFDMPEMSDTFQQSSQDTESFPMSPAPLSEAGFPSMGGSDYTGDEDDQMLAATIEHSKKLYYQDPSLGESSAAVYTEAYGPGEDRAATPTPSSMYPPPPRQPQGSALEADTLDDRFKVHHSNYFQFGEVFKMLWSEPRGQKGLYSNPDELEHPPTDIQEAVVGHEHFYWGVRRFVVVGTDGGNSVCVPILTYEQKGCKKGAKPEKHGIVYQPPHKPTAMSKEPTLGMHPVRMRIYAEGEKLHKASRVNYSKLVTIEHNFKVFFIGSIYQEDLDTVEDSVSQCWEQRKRHRHKHNKDRHGHRSGRR